MKEPTWFLLVTGFDYKFILIDLSKDEIHNNVAHLNFKSRNCVYLSFYLVNRRKLAFQWPHLTRDWDWFSSKLLEQITTEQIIRQIISLLWIFG